MEFRTNYLDEVNPDPLGDLVLNYLIDLDREDEFLDFKETLDISKGSAFPKTAKDIFAFANRGGGWILVGYRQTTSGKDQNQSTTKRNFIPMGLPEYNETDQASLQQKFNAYCGAPISLGFRAFHRLIEGLQRRFAAIYIPPSTRVLVPVRDGTYYVDDKPQVAFKGGTVLFRRGTQSVQASEEELAWIRKRCEQHEYSQSVLSGIPDRIEESLFTNLLLASKVPQTISTALLLPGGLGPLSALREGPQALCLVQGKMILALDDINAKSPIWTLVEPGSIRQHKLGEWITDQDKRQLVTKILNNAVVDLGQKVGLSSSRDKLFYPCHGLKRTKIWKTRFRDRSERTVAVRMLARQLQRHVWVHSAVEAKFLWIETKLVLRLTPTFVITSDGERALFGYREGTIITRLTNRMHNRGYLNSLLFWIFVLSENTGGARIELGGGILTIGCKPVSSTMRVGIQSDRSVSEQREVTAKDDEESSW